MLQLETRVLTMKHFLFCLIVYMSVYVWPCVCVCVLLDRAERRWKANEVHSTFSPSPSVCHSADTLVWSGSWCQSKTSFSRNMTIPPFHSSVSHCANTGFQSGRCTLAKAHIYSAKMFALLLNITVQSLMWSYLTGSVDVHATDLTFQSQFTVHGTR